MFGEPPVGCGVAGCCAEGLLGSPSRPPYGQLLPDVATGSAGSVFTAGLTARTRSVAWSSFAFWSGPFLLLDVATGSVGSLFAAGLTAGHGVCTTWSAARPPSRQCCLVAYAR
ncbi:hypothetical protein V6N13_124082 [Hibiscus sabdariffa]